MDNVLLSICIPTYNRCEVLQNTLNNLFSNPEFDPNLVEVIVTDNCSTDNTKAIVSKFPLVRYYCNKEYREYVNFPIVLSYAKGLYIKLFNDTLTFKPSQLSKMLHLISINVKSECNVLFYSDMFLNQSCSKMVNSANSYLKEVSFYSTAIANFGAWRADFEVLEDKDRCASLLFSQVDWTYKLVNNHKPTIIYFSDWFEVASVSGKGGYHIVDVFVNNYFEVLRLHKISLLRWEIEKYYLMRDFMIAWLIRVLITHRQDFTFQTKDWFKILFKKYYYEPYFYGALLYFFFYRIKFAFK